MLIDDRSKRLSHIIGDTLVEYVKIERALVNICEELPDTPRWAALITLEGAIVRHYPTLMDGDHIAVLTHSLITQSRHLLTDTGSGLFHYNICAGADGIYFTFLLGEAHLLALLFPRVTTVDAILRQVPRLAAPALELLNRP